MRQNFFRVCILLLLSITTSVNAIPGLDSRPSNENCIAGERPQFGSVKVERVFPDLNMPFMPFLDMQLPAGDTSYWYAAGRSGLVYKFENDPDVTTPVLVLDIMDRFNQDDYFLQWGINSIALHPNFPETFEIYISYNTRVLTTDHATSYVSRFTSSDGGATFDEASEEVLFTVNQLANSHHVGNLLFGPDGYLYIGSGDSALKGQDPYDLRGKLLRIDVDVPPLYGIPPDNPFAVSGGAPEIYAMGLRNPWRFSFDKDTGELWLGDVGESTWEEINIIENGGNYGWPVMEASTCLNPPTGCDTTGLSVPLFEYSHVEGVSVIGGYVYRGDLIPDMQGKYIFTDYEETVLRTLSFESDGSVLMPIIGDGLWKFSAFIEDPDGELYGLSSWRGKMYQILPADPVPPEAEPFPEFLSETGCFSSMNPPVADSGLIPYTVNTNLWSDGVDKKRWMALPDGTQVQLAPDGDWQFPVGSVLIKEFSSGGQAIETRLFMRHDDGGWGGYSYEWNDDHTDAKLLPAGKTKQINPDLNWLFPSTQQCFSCHDESSGFALGPENLQLNGDFTYPSTGKTSNQLATLDHIGLISGGLPDTHANLQALSGISDENKPVTLRARSYLHANCSFCHRPGGPTPVSMDFRYNTALEYMNSCNVTPDAGILGVSGAKILLPGNTAKSIISLRMHDLGDKRMPPIATSIVDQVAVSVIDSWIADDTVCDPVTDTDLDGTSDMLDNCSITSNASQLDVDGDQFGNACDADLNNDGIVNALDLGTFKQAFFSAGSTIADINGDQIVNALDLGLFKQLFFQPPGPSGLEP